MYKLQEMMACLHLCFITYMRNVLVHYVRWNGVSCNVMAACLPVHHCCYFWVPESVCKPLCVCIDIGGYRCM